MRIFSYHIQELKSKLDFKTSSRVSSRASRNQKSWQSMLYEEHDKQVPPMSPREVEDDDERNVWLFFFVVLIFITFLKKSRTAKNLIINCRCQNLHLSLVDQIILNEFSRSRKSCVTKSKFTAYRSK